MTTVTKIGAGMGALALVAGVYLALKPAPEAPKEKRPPDAVHEMHFPKGLGDVTGDETGRVCHKVILRTPSGDRLLKRTFLDGKNWRNASEATKEGWIKEDAAAAVDEAGMACLDDPFFRSAYADPPHCEDCGGGCVSWACPATLIVPLNDCTYGGHNCVISVICCGAANCVESCNP